MPVLKAKKGDETVEFEFDEIVEPPEGLLPASQVEENYVSKDHFESEINRRIASAKTNERKAVKDDDEFLQEVAKSKWGVKFKDGKPVTGSDVDVEEIRQSVKDSIYKDEVEPLKNENSQLRQTTLSNAVMRAATKLGVKKEKLQEVYKGKSLLELQALDHFEYDPETGQWAKRKASGDGFEITSKSDSKHPYVGPEEWVEKLKKDPNYKDWFEDNTQQGSGFNGGSGGPKNPNDEFEQKKQTVRQIRGKT